MSNTRSFMAAMALALAALPVAAEPAPARAAPDGFVHVGGDVGWELEQHRYFDADGARPAPHASNATASAAPASGAVPGDFAFVGGETGWQLVPQAYAWRGGRFVRSDPVRGGNEPAARVTTRDLEEMARLYAGG